MLADDAAVVKELIRPEFDGRREVLLTGAQPIEGLPAGSGTLRPARIVADEPERVVVAADATAPSALVLADAWAPGWEVTVDGKPRPLLRANLYVRGVVLHPGDRMVELVYTPPGFAAGLTIGAVALAVTILAALWSGGRMSRSAASGQRVHPCRVDDAEIRARSAAGTEMARA